MPILYLRGLSKGDFAEALPVLLGPQAAGLSSSTITLSWPKTLIRLTIGGSEALAQKGYSC